MGSETSPESLKRQCAERKAKKGHVSRTGNPVGRPKGGNLTLKAFADAMDRGDLPAAMDTLLEVAKDPDHKHWASAQKFILDRVANSTNYEKKSGISNAPVVNINISGIDTPDVVEGEFVEVDD